MSLKQEIETWVSALERYDNNEFEESLKVFSAIPDTSKILFNCGVIHATLGEHAQAVACYQRAVRLDQYLAVAYFQQGVSNFLVGDFEEALANFNDTLLYLRGNNMIDYAQLGLAFRLYSCEVLFNRGLCYIYLQQEEAGMQDFSFAVKEKVVEDHNVIDEAIKEKADASRASELKRVELVANGVQGYTVFSIPVGVLYRPNAAKVKNLKTKDYLGKARLVAASDSANTFTGFAGSEIKRANTIRSEGRDDRPPENISYAAANLVKPGLSSKRQQSEPPLNRNVFPPTPPPESERTLSGSSTSGSIVSRGASVRNKPKPLDLNIENKAPRYEIREEQPRTEASRAEPPRRPRTTRAASEAGGPRRRERNGGLDPAPTMHRRRASADVEDGENYADMYDMYRDSRGARSIRSRPQQDLIEEEDEEGSDPGFNQSDFDMLPPRQPVQQQPQMPPMRSMSHSRRGSSRRPEIRKVRVLVHGTEDNRYILIGTEVQFHDFHEKIKEKFQMRKRFKLKIRDDDMPDGDMITMGDQDDLEMALMSVKENARREGADMGKLEVWAHEF